MSSSDPWNRVPNKELHDLYMQSLPEPGWVGDLDRAELAYVEAQFRQPASLRRKWGFRPSARRLSDGRIRQVAISGALNKGGVTTLPRGRMGPGLAESMGVRPTLRTPDMKTGLPMPEGGKERHTVGASDLMRSDRRGGGG